ncbi:UvrD-helicase domain-containing protein [Demequina rhizosphaerae]|uniref:UvrD-helicase domain-containing protein n=1 Tax=Demequina rhizosphaerae TaxID=1638985 RepID=UPI000781E79D|nr:UvrD-helicase domain-containing protein [Demequina rhizosphaerae]
MSDFVPTDQVAREAIRDRVDVSMFVDAGAGSGKTTSLVARVVSLVSGGADMSRIAVVTFTEKAAAELRDRLRAGLERALLASPGEAGARYRDALTELDAAAIGTIHSFARRILSEHAIEAGMPPLVEVRTEIESSIAATTRWRDLSARLLDDATVADEVTVLLASGVGLDDLEKVVGWLDDNWDLIPAASGPAPTPVVAMVPVDAARRALEAIAAGCGDPSDSLRLKIGEAVASAARASSAAGNAEALRALGAVAAIKAGRAGLAGNWGGTAGKAAALAALETLKEAASEARAGYFDALTRRIVAWLGREVRASADRRRADGVLEFHDLLVLARDLVRSSRDARVALSEGYAHLLLDEFQDTDPLQIEIAARIAAGPDAPADLEWSELDIEPGRLFVVGDPKQSIYRFRRADIAVYLGARERFAQAAGGERLERLTTNFRTIEPVVRWVNEVFAPMLADSVPYDPLVAFRPAPLGGVGPAPVLRIGACHDDLNADAARDLEAAEVAGVIATALAERWSVADPHTGEERPVRPGDIAILLPARTALPDICEALDDARVPYESEASTRMYTGAYVADVLLAARAISNRNDRLALVSALRSPLFACGDDDLLRWKLAGHYLSLSDAVADDEAAGPVGAALLAMREWERAARTSTPAQILQRIVDERRVLERSADTTNAREAWSSVRRVIDRARAWSDATHGGLRDYLAWVEHDRAAVDRKSEPVLPETDLDAVRIMTIHAAKGLEFPMVVLAGGASVLTKTTNDPVLRGEGALEVRLGGSLETRGYGEAAGTEKERLREEAYRKLYVGATRARDRLVVSLHHTKRSRSNCFAGVLAEQLDAGAGAAVMDEWRLGEERPRYSVSPLGSGGAVESWDAFEARTSRAREAAARVFVTSPSGLEGTGDGTAVVTVEAVASVRGAEGAAAGRVAGPPDLRLGTAVHDALERISFASPDDVEPVAVAAAVRAGMPDAGDLVVALVRSALASTPVREAAGLEHWKESFVGGVSGDLLVEGYVDLMYRRANGSVVVVDFKTDDVPADALGARAAFYAPQVLEYARLVGAATGALVEARLLFLRRDGAAAVQVAVD